MIAFDKMDEDEFQNLYERVKDVLFKYFLREGILNHYLVAAANINRALDNLEKSLSTFVIPYEIVKIEDTKFVEVIPYIPDDKERIPDNLKPQQ